jgi:hypothetical protein
VPVVPQIVGRAAEERHGEYRGNLYVLLRGVRDGELHYLRRHVLRNEIQCFDDEILKVGAQNVAHRPGLHLGGDRPVEEGAGVHYIVVIRQPQRPGGRQVLQVDDALGQVQEIINGALDVAGQLRRNAGKEFSLRVGQREVEPAHGMRIINGEYAFFTILDLPEGHGSSFQTETAPQVTGLRPQATTRTRHRTTSVFD